MQIIPLKTPRRRCASCGYLFKLIDPHHTLCRDCWAWDRIARNIDENMRLLRGMGL